MLFDFPDDNCVYRKKSSVILYSVSSLLRWSKPSFCDVCRGALLIVVSFQTTSTTGISFDFSDSPLIRQPVIRKINGINLFEIDNK